MTITAKKQKAKELVQTVRKYQPDIILGWISIIALYLIFFFMSIMFSTIFALAIRDMGVKTKKAEWETYIATFQDASGDSTAGEKWQVMENIFRLG